MKIKDINLEDLSKRLTELDDMLSEHVRLLAVLNHMYISKYETEKVKNLIELLEYKLSVIRRPESFKELKSEIKLKKVMNDEIFLSNKTFEK